MTFPFASRALRRGFIAAVLAMVVLAAPSELPAQGAVFERASGSILAPIGRQAGWLNLDAPRHRLITALTAPDYVSDVSASGEWAVLTVSSPYRGAQGTLGADLYALDLASSEMYSYVLRSQANESVGPAVWDASSNTTLFVREDLRQLPVSYPGQSVVRYPSRIERIGADGSPPVTIVKDGMHPALAPDGREVLYVRAGNQGVSLRQLDMVSTEEREIVPPGQFPDIAYPRYSPRGDTFAFMAAVRLVASSSRRAMGPPFVPTVHAHGLPWDVWVAQRDGSGLRRIADLGADDASLAWSPDGAQIFVYGGAGSFVVDVSTGEANLISHIGGYGGVAWVADAS